MTSITFYASEANRNAAFTKAKLWMFFSVVVFLFAPYGPVLAIPLFAIGFWFGGPELGARAAQCPSFTADTEGFVTGQRFTVTDRHRLGWDEFRGVELRTEGFEPFFAQRVLVIKTANHGEQKIRQQMMSGTPEGMAREISDYARAAQMAKGMRVIVAEIEQSERRATQSSAPLAQVAQASAPVAKPVAARTGPRPQQPVRQAQIGGDASPITSTPRLSERLFGRRKVI
ncbi:hypothetical protein [Octadecabacter sp. R77987]|uniref:hypothetical protein n=1 Tax=Octadecabacter sp. R77987 TaxID=3093874 RepID=UPI0036712C59